MKTSLSIVILTSVLAWVPAQAADPGPVASSAPSAGERMGVARQAIATQDWKKALAELKRAVRDEPDNADIHNLLGYSYRKQARPDLPKAFEHYKTAIRLNPEHKGAHEYIGEAYLMDKKPQEAEKHLQSLEKLCGNTRCEEYADLSKAIADFRAKH